ncbi:MAG: hypothetical protein IPL32_20545 [Chloracidobacterium sp.]|nr:hypothetical protein [Chloracidobacterium sp.]
MSEQNQNVRTPRRDAAGQIVGDTLSNGRLDNEAAFTGVMVDGYDTSDTNRNGSRDEEVWTYDMDADQATLSETVNTYAIILGQAQVVKSVTTSDAAKRKGGKLEVIGKTEVVGGVTSLSHGWSHSVTTVLYGFNRVGQLVSATGRTVSEQNQNVRTPRRDAAGQIVGTRYRTGGWTMRRRLRE